MKLHLEQVKTNDILHGRYSDFVDSGFVKTCDEFVIGCHSHRCLTGRPNNFGPLSLDSFILVSIHSKQRSKGRCDHHHNIHSNFTNLHLFCKEKSIHCSCFENGLETCSYCHDNQQPRRTHS